MLFKDLEKRLASKQLSLKVTDRAKEYISDTAFDPVYGARPLKRFIQTNVETMIAKAIIGRDIEEGSTLTVDYDGQNLIVK